MRSYSILMSPTIIADDKPVDKRAHELVERPFRDGT